MKTTLIDIVGHFGTEFSYGTVASNVARALDDAGMLGVVQNMDPEWHPAHRDLSERTLRGHGTHLILFAPPHHYHDAFAEAYGRARSAIFMSPNTDTLDDEHALTCESFSLAICPSRWCRVTVERSVPDIETVVLPLGVDRLIWDRSRYERRVERVQAEKQQHTVLHFSSDQFWPGRKGTEELFRAWALGDHGKRAKLIAHIPPALLVQATYLLRELDIDDTVELVVGNVHGGAAALRGLIDSADLVVAPSRCEGFGIMLLSSLYAGVPLVSTFNTGHADFLEKHHGWLGVPTRENAAMFGESGFAPVVEPVALSTTLHAAINPHALLQMMSANDAKGDESLAWDSKVKAWTDAISEWAKGG
jgi:glycosyltransferase involved in cell wall biosynthesis